MSSQVTFYTQPTLERSIVHSQLTGATESGYSIKHLQNKNLDDTWKPTSTGTQVLLFDLYPQNTTEEAAAYLAGRGAVYPDATGTYPYYDTSGSSGAIDTFGVWLRNYQGIGASVGSISYRSRLTAAGGSGPDILGQTWVNSGENGLWYKDLTVAHTQRYAWIYFANLTGIPEIASVFFLKKRTVQARPHYVLKSMAEYYNDVKKMRGGRELVSLQAQNCTYSFDQKYTFITDARTEVFNSVFHDSKGRFLPLIYQEKTAIKDAYVVRLMQKTLNMQEIYKNYHMATIKFKTLAYKRSGDRY